MSNRAGLCFLVVLFLAGCVRQRDPYYCPGANPNDNCAEDAGPMACTSNDQCTAPLGVCDVTGSGTCVQCTPDQAGACSGATPACGEDRTCRACRAHAECAGSEACLPDGTCAEPAQVAYVKPTSLGGTDNTSCTLMFPCTKVARALATGRPYVKLAGTTDEAVTVQGAQVVTFLAEPDAKLTRTAGAGAILTVLEIGTSLTVYDLSISNAPNDPNGIGIVIPAAGGAPALTLIRAKVMSNPGGGISASGGALTVSQSTISGNAGGGISVTGGALTVSQSTISGNAGGGISVTGGALTVSQSTISGNAGGGISVSGGTFVIVGNVFFNNGNDTQTVGGVAIDAPQSPANRLEFNTFSLNKAMAGKGLAIDCFAGVFTARNNIMSQNGTLANMEQVDGTCAHAYSIVRPGTLPSGAGNSSMDPLFVDMTTGDLHVRAGSPALGAADPASDLTGPAELDIDGQRRASPADIGADEVP